MPDTLNELEERLEKIEGPDGIAALEADIDKMEKGLKQQTTLIQGQLQAVSIIKRLLSAHKRAWGIHGEHLSDVPKIVEAEKENPIAKEVSQRIADKKCTYRAKGGKWCARKLSTKATQESGYCKIHMQELGLEEKKK